MSIPNQVEESITLRSIWKAGGPVALELSKGVLPLGFLSGSLRILRMSGLAKENISYKLMTPSVCRSSGSANYLSNADYVREKGPACSLPVSKRPIVWSKTVQKKSGRPNGPKGLNILLI